MEKIQHIFDIGLFKTITGRNMPLPLAAMMAGLCGAQVLMVAESNVLPDDWQSWDWRVKENRLRAIKYFLEKMNIKDEGDINFKIQRNLISRLEQILPGFLQKAYCGDVNRRIQQFKKEAREVFASLEPKSLAKPAPGVEAPRPKPQVSTIPQPPQHLTPPQPKPQPPTQHRPAPRHLPYPREDNEQVKFFKDTANRLRVIMYFLNRANIRDESTLMSISPNTLYNRINGILPGFLKIAYKGTLDEKIDKFIGDARAVLARQPPSQTPSQPSYRPQPQKRYLSPLEYYLFKSRTKFIPEEKRRDFAVISSEIEKGSLDSVGRSPKDVGSYFYLLTLKAQIYILKNFEALDKEAQNYFWEGLLQYGIPNLSNCQDVDLLLHPDMRNARIKMIEEIVNLIRDKIGQVNGRVLLEIDNIIAGKKERPVIQPEVKPEPPLEKEVVEPPKVVVAAMPAAPVREPEIKAEDKISPVSPPAPVVRAVLAKKPVEAAEDKVPLPVVPETLPVEKEIRAPAIEEKNIIPEEKTPTVPIEEKLAKLSLLEKFFVYYRLERLKWYSERMRRIFDENTQVDTIIKHELGNLCRDIHASLKAIFQKEARVGLPGRASVPVPGVDEKKRMARDALIQVFKKEGLTKEEILELEGQLGSVKDFGGIWEKALKESGFAAKKKEVKTPEVTVAVSEPPKQPWLPSDVKNIDWESVSGIITFGGPASLEEIGWKKIEPILDPYNREFLSLRAREVLEENWLGFLKAAKEKVRAGCWYRLNIDKLIQDAEKGIVPTFIPGKKVAIGSLLPQAKLTPEEIVYKIIQVKVSKRRKDQESFMEIVACYLKDVFPSQSEVNRRFNKSQAYVSSFAHSSLKEMGITFRDIFDNREKVAILLEDKRYVNSIEEELKRLPKGPSPKKIISEPWVFEVRAKRPRTMREIEIGKKLNEIRQSDNFKRGSSLVNFELLIDYCKKFGMKENQDVMVKAIGITPPTLRKYLKMLKKKGIEANALQGLIEEEITAEEIAAAILKVKLTRFVDEHTRKRFDDILNYYLNPEEAKYITPMEVAKRMGIYQHYVFISLERLKDEGVSQLDVFFKRERIKQLLGDAAFTGKIEETIRANKQIIISKQDCPDQFRCGSGI